MSIGGGIFLIALGAILSFAVHVNTPGFNLTDIGYILMVAGVIVTVIGIAFVFRRRSSVTTNRTAVDPASGERVDQVKSTSTL